MKRSLVWLQAIIFFAVLTSSLTAGKAPLKIYILAGQSNMQGHAKIATFDYIGDDPATASLLKEMRDSKGRPRVCDNVWITYLTGKDDKIGEITGKLTAGYGGRRDFQKDEDKIGPEFTFGITMEEAGEGQALIIKTAWGGKSLNTDFRPPGAGPFEFNKAQLERFAQQGKDVATIKAEKAKATGHYYRLMMQHIQKVLADPGRVCPAYDPKTGFEIGGFVWFQGWNDMVDRGVYPNRGKPGGYDLYSELMAQFIRDVRKDLSAPEMPFVIGVMGVGGPVDGPDAEPRTKEIQRTFRAAMAAPASMPEFRGSVFAVKTAPYWDTDLAKIEKKLGKVHQMAQFLRTKHKDHANKDGKMSPKQQQAWLKNYRSEVLTPEEETEWKRGGSNGDYHYLGSAKTMALIGKAFADSLLCLPP